MGKRNGIEAQKYTWNPSIIKSLFNDISTRTHSPGVEPVSARLNRELSPDSHRHRRRTLLV